MEGFMDKDRMMHIGAEVVVIAAVTFWLNGRISSLESSLELMTKKFEAHEGAINRQAEVIQELQSSERQQLPPSPQYNTRGHPKMIQPPRGSINDEPTYVSEPEIVRRPPRKAKANKIRPPPPPSDSEDGEYALLSELKNIESGRQEPIELEFE